MIGGAGLAGAMASVVMASAVLFGLAQGGPSLWVFLGGALGAVAFLRWGLDSSGWQRGLGAVAVGVAAVALGLATGFGWLEGAGLAGAVIAATPKAVDYLRSIQIPEWWWAPVAAMVVLLLTPSILDGGALGHDESAYALKAKTWLYDTPGSGWNLNRGIGMSLYAVPIIAIGGSEPALRFLGVVSLGWPRLGDLVAWLTTR